jgi:hypothetical protein
MANIINASKTSTTGLVQTADGSGVLQLQADGVTGLTVGTGGVLTAANGIVMSSMTLGTATAGQFEYDGRVPYFTPLGTQRGVVPGMQYYRLESGYLGTNVATAQSVFGVGCTLSGSTVYQFEAVYSLGRTGGSATSHTIGTGFGGTATLNNIAYQATTMDSSVSYTASLDAMQSIQWIQTASSTAIIAPFSGATLYISTKITGTVSVNAGGTFIPQYTLSAAPGAYTTSAGCYFAIWPISASGSNTSVGTWA